jgi:hypothetical protein
MMMINALNKEYHLILRLKSLSLVQGCPLIGYFFISWFPENCKNFLICLEQAWNDITIPMDICVAIHVTCDGIIGIWNLLCVALVTVDKS